MDQQLAVFVAVAEKRNFSRAAESLHLTQPAVSQQIQALERQMGTRLLERSSKSVQLTPSGRIVYEHAKEILGSYARMKAFIDDLNNSAKGTIAVGASYTFGEYILPHVVARFRQLYPNILPNIRIGNTHEIAAAVVQRQIDVGIVEGEVQLESILVEPFAEDQMVVIAHSHHPWQVSTTPSIEQLRVETWIVREPGSGTRAWEEHLFTVLGFQPAVRMEFGSTQIIKEAVAAGLGVALLSNWTIQKELFLGTLRIVPTRGTPLRRQFSLVLRQSPFATRAMELFLQFIRRESGTPQAAE